MAPRSSHLNRAAAALLAAGALLTAVSGCGRGYASAPATGPRELGPVTAASFASGKPVTAMIPYRTRAQLAQLANAGFEIWYVDQKGKKVYGQLDRVQLATVKRLGLEARIVQAPGTRNEFDAGYHTYAETKAELTAIAAAHPDFVKLIDIGDSWEKTQGKADRDILGLRIGKGDLAKKPAVLFVGNHHAREIVTPEIVLAIAHMLVDGYGTDADATHFVESRDIYLVPMANPDGHELAVAGNDWRKNADTESGGGHEFGYGPNGPGVDLNRNYGFKWGFPGASDNPVNATFRGPAPFSEPETQAVKRLVESRDFAFLMTYHSFSNLILWPWGYTDAPPPDKRMPVIGKKLGDLSGYLPEQSCDLYPTSGDTTDWAYGEHGILAYTTEIGGWNDGFDPPYSRFSKFWKENEPGARLLLNLADNPDHVFGPEVKAASARGGSLSVALPKGATAAEFYVGAEGPDGQGTPIAVDGARAQAPLPRAAAGQLVLVHARDAKGAWGPYKAVFGR